jgi:hypothetical protein
LEDVETAGTGRDGGDGDGRASLGVAAAALAAGGLFADALPDDQAGALAGGGPVVLGPPAGKSRV